MFSFFKRKKEAEFTPLMTGRSETTYDQLKVRFGANLTGRIYSFDIEENVSEFSESLKLPRKIHEAIRNVLDDYIKDGEEFYFQVDERNYGLFFSKASKPVAELKTQVIKNEISRTLKELINRSSIEALPDPEIQTEAAEQADIVEDLADYITDDRGILTRHPSERDLRDWITRAASNMSTKFGPEDLIADVNKLAVFIKIQYHPVWYANTKILSAYIASTTAPLVPGKVDYEAQDNLAILGAAVRQLKTMHGAGEHALIIVPVSLRTICGDETRELYNVYLRSVQDDIKNYIVLKLEGVQALKWSKSDWDALKALTHHCRSIIVDTNQELIRPRDLALINFHSYGFDLTNNDHPEDKLFKKIEEFCNFYQSEKKDIFIFGIQSQSLLSAALGNGYVYISGPAIFPPMVRPRHAAYMNIDELYRNALT